jgi:uncharacterized HAD superfamily protein
MNLCYYKDIFGKPKTGIHKYRLFNLAIVDIIGTIIIAYIIAYYYNLSYKKTITIAFLLGIILHKIFCVKTTLNNIIFNE